MIIGVDIGGTHTDAVVVEKGKMIHFKKSLTTDPLEIGFMESIKEFLHLPIEVVKVGTTHATNALLEGKDLFTVGVVRLAGHRPLLNPPGLVEVVDGGFEFDGRPITPFNKQQVVDAIDRLIAKGAESIAVVGAFSSIYPEQELECLIEGIPITLSHQLGGVGFLERENGAILNAALKKPIQKGLSQLQKVCPFPILFTQNNGSTIQMEEAIAYPLLTLSSGPTNSFVGAAKMAQLLDAIVVDIGGTSTDVGVVRHGIPRRSMKSCSFGGVDLNFPMPDVLSIAIGGGSHVQLNPLQIGPRSSGKNLFREGISFGGSQLTLTDLHRQPQRESKEVFSVVQTQINRLIAQIETKRLPVVVVGGGAYLYSNPEAVYPAHAGVANAFGAALAEKSCTLTKIESLENREEMISSLKQEVSNTLKAYAKVQIDMIEVIPYNYLPGHLARYTVIGRGVSP